MDNFFQIEEFLQNNLLDKMNKILQGGVLTDQKS